MIRAANGFFNHRALGHIAFHAPHQRLSWPATKAGIEQHQFLNRLRAA